MLDPEFLNGALLNEEVWKSHSDFPDYEFSSLGRARSFRRKTVRYFVGTKQRGGHRSIDLCSKTGERPPQRFLHIMIAELFLGPKPKDKDVVCHINGNPEDNRAQNLRYGTHQENSFDRHKHNGTSKDGKRSRVPKRAPSEQNPKAALRELLVAIMETCIGKTTVTIPMSLAKEIAEEFTVK